MEDKTFNFNLIEQYLSLKPEEKSDFLVTPQVAEDVDFQSFFKFVDKTNSSIGQQYLYDKMHHLDCSDHSFNYLEKQILHYKNNENEKKQSQVLLTKLNTFNDYYFPFLIFGELPNKMPYLWLVKCLQLLAVLFVGLSIMNRPFLLALIPLFFVNLLIHYWHKNRIGNFLEIFYRLNKLTKSGRGLQQHAPGQSEQILTNIKNVESLSSTISYLNTDSLKDSEFGSFIWFFLELLKVLTLSEVIFFHKIIEEIQVKRKDIFSIFKFIGDIDVSMSILQLRSELPYYCKPEFKSQSKEIEIQGLYHPLVENCISNDLYLKNKSLLLTGSNMSGKSTFIKSISLNLIASQALNTAFAKSSSNPRLNLSTSMRIADNINEGSSYFLEEVHSIGNMLSQSENENAQHLFVIDEVFKGTNTIERISAGKSILSYLNQSQHIILVSTHDIELANMLESEFDLYYFQESIENESLAFDYKLKRGKLEKKNAINIMKISGYPSSIISEAQDLAEKLENEKIGMTLRKNMPKSKFDLNE